MLAQHQFQIFNIICVQYETFRILYTFDPYSFHSSTSINFFLILSWDSTIHQYKAVLDEI
jgi:hypothetical protein